MAAQEAVDAGLRSGANPLLETLGKISDWPAVKQYRQEVTNMFADIERARAQHNEPRVLELQKEMIEVVAKIRESVSAGGKLKQAGNKRKNIRDGFRSAVKRIVKKIEGTDTAFAEHLSKSLIYGDFPKYQPASLVSWETEPVINA